MRNSNPTHSVSLWSYYPVMRMAFENSLLEILCFENVHNCIFNLNLLIMQTHNQSMFYLMFTSGITVAR